jgi:hypothetical protein
MKLTFDVGDAIVRAEGYGDPTSGGRIVGLKLLTL